jgi:hypothetical protein
MQLQPEKQPLPQRPEPAKNRAWRNSFRSKMPAPYETSSVSNLAKRFWSLLVMLLCMNFGNKSRKKAIFPKLFFIGWVPEVVGLRVTQGIFGFLWFL